MHIGQSILTTLKPERQLFVVETQLIQERGVKVVNVDLFLDDPKAKVICLAITVARFEATSGDPHCERVDVMITAGQ